MVIATCASTALVDLSERFNICKNSAYRGLWEAGLPERPPVLIPEPLKTCSMWPRGSAGE